MIMMTDPVLKKIHSRGYWRVNIRPTMFVKKRIPSLTECQEIMESCAVRLLGGEYPYVYDEKIVKGQDWIEYSSDSDWIIEYWRLYQSGQFIHHFACHEDWRPREHLIQPSSEGPLPPKQSFLLIPSTIHRLTEIFEFAARLAAKEILTPGAVISTKLAGMKDRRLGFFDPSRVLTGIYKSHIPDIEFQKTFAEAELLGRANELALDAVEWMFERFNLPTAYRKTWAQDQMRFLERRI